MYRKIHKQIVTLQNINFHSNFCTVTPAISQEHAINKIIVTRTPSEMYSLYIDYDETIANFRSRLSRLFPNSAISVIDATQNQDMISNLAQERLVQEIQNWYETIKQVSLIDALIFNKIILCELTQKNTLQLIYGVQVAEHNLTNRINIPEYIEQGVAQLNRQWQGNMTVGDALSFSNIRRFQQGTIVSQSGKPLTNNLSPFQETTLQNSIINLMQIKQYNIKVKGNYLTNSANQLMRRILLLMSTNWVFLFAVTYGKYGWDVGQPISYLTDLGVDLVAMLGIFKAERALRTRAQEQKAFIQAIMNLKANQRMNEWRVSYLSRKIIAD